MKYDEVNMDNTITYLNPWETPKEHFTYKEQDWT